ncbi:unnamed protein product [Ectocarpus sp. CCAP 1310/34]|nr:unnamed protein product [Ectocarpus sp. CCAP 1310/34]
MLALIIHTDTILPGMSCPICISRKCADSPHCSWVTRTGLSISSPFESNTIVGYIPPY